MGKNVSIYKSQASALEKFAAKGVKVVVVANPANTNALILHENAPSLPASDITCMTRLDHNRALGQVGERLGVPSSHVKNVIIWGNHSSTQYPDVNHGSVTLPDGATRPHPDGHRRRRLPGRAVHRHRPAARRRHHQAAQAQLRPQRRVVRVRPRPGLDAGHGGGNVDEHGGDLRERGLRGAPRPLLLLPRHLQGWYLDHCGGPAH